ncbi:MAG: hypothetical protein KKF36_07895 [Alphaproteobacteria bacterium]|nr:hypothetical protein [Alphaproteobacteria bacterium]
MDPGKPNFARLRTLQVSAVMAGVSVFVISGLLMGVFRAPGVATVVLALAFASATFGAVFYFGALLLEGSLQKYILSDETVIQGDDVKMVTHTASSGDPVIDKWIGTYAFARNLFGMSIVPILILAALYYFG